MKNWLTIILVLNAWLSNAQPMTTYDQVEQSFIDSGFTKTVRWMKDSLNDTTDIYRKFLKLKAIHHFDDAIGYRTNLDFLNDQTRWMEQSIQLKHSNRSLSYSITGSKAIRFGLQAHQLNADVYYVLSKHVYANADVAIGQFPLYPNYRASAKIYFTGIKKLELAAGYSHVSFKDNSVKMWRFSSGFYFSNYYLYAEYLHINTLAQRNYAVVVWLRNYLRNEKGYFFINASAGLQSDRLNVYGDFINSRRLSGGVNYRVAPRFSFELALSTEKQIISEVLNRQLLSVNTGIFYHFQIDKRK